MEASHTCYTSVGTNLLINLQLFRKNQWFISAKFFIGHGLIHGRCCVAQLTSLFIASKWELDLFCQQYGPGLGAPTLSSMHYSHHNNMTALFTKRTSLRTLQYSRLYSEPSADCIQQEEQKNETLVFSELAGHELQPQQDRCSLRTRCTVWLKCADSIHAPNDALNVLQTEFHGMLLSLPAYRELMTAFVLCLHGVKGPKRNQVIDHKLHGWNQTFLTPQS